MYEQRELTHNASVKFPMVTSKQITKGTNLHLISGSQPAFQWTK